WLGYCYFQAGEYEAALKVYEGMLSRNEFMEEVFVYRGCCLFFNGMYEQARDSVISGAQSGLQIRVLCHIAFKLGDRQELQKN
ncbi:hypothetical protein PFISCL1PPCAC_5732, partial [Pristionchus fissidentatus]